jgi:hypothetical protein
MAESIWYYLEGRKQRGPISWEELSRRAATGAVEGDTLVWSPSMSEWTEAAKIEGLVVAGAPMAPPPLPEETESFLDRSRILLGAAAERVRRLSGSASQPEAMPHVRWVDGLLEALSRGISAERLDRLDRAAAALGHGAYLLAAALATAAWVVAAVSAQEWRWLLYAMLIPLAAVICHYAAVRFLEAGAHLIAKTPSRLASRAFLRCFGLLAFLGSAVALGGAVVRLVEGGGLVVPVMGVLAAAVLAYAGGVALSPESLHLEVGADAEAGEEAVGVLTFLLKLPLRLLPLLFGAGAVGGAVVAVVMIRQAYQVPFLSALAQQSRLVLAVGLLPFGIYVLFLAYYLFLAVLRAILAIPGRVEGKRPAR